MPLHWARTPPNTTVSTESRPRPETPPTPSRGTDWPNTACPRRWRNRGARPGARTTLPGSRPECSCKTDSNDWWPCSGPLDTHRRVWRDSSRLRGHASDAASANSGDSGSPLDPDEFASFSLGRNRWRRLLERQRIPTVSGSGLGIGRGDRRRRATPSGPWCVRVAPRRGVVAATVVARATRSMVRTKPSAGPSGATTTCGVARARRRAIGRASVLGATYHSAIAARTRAPHPKRRKKDATKKRIEAHPIVPNSGSHCSFHATGVTANPGASYYVAHQKAETTSAAAEVVVRVARGGVVVKRRFRRVGAPEMVRAGPERRSPVPHAWRLWLHSGPPQKYFDRERASFSSLQAMLKKGVSGKWGG
jgi:hypothetical protein